MNKSVNLTTPPDRATQWAHFRATTPPTALMVGQSTWSVYDTQAGAQAVLLLPANGAPTAALFPYIEALRPHYRVIAPDIPRNVRKLESAVLGVVAVLDQLGIHKAHTIGISWGAMLVQMLLRGHASRVGDAVITHTTTPNPERAVILKQQRALLRFLPNALMMPFLRGGMVRAIASAQADTTPEERAFWQSYYSTLYRTEWTRAHVLARANIACEFAAQTPFQTKDILGWGGRLLVIESQEDEVIDEGQRGALKGMYPNAYVQTLEACGHLATVLMSDALAQSMLKFLAID